jgi:cell division septum initiation protein DivIVA
MKNLEKSNTFFKSLEEEVQELRQENQELRERIRFLEDQVRELSQRGFESRPPKKRSVSEEEDEEKQLYLFESAVQGVREEKEVVIPRQKKKQARNAKRKKVAKQFETREVISLFFRPFPQSLKFFFSTRLPQTDTFQRV